MDHIDLVDPVGESLEAKEGGTGGSGAELAPSREGRLEAAQEQPLGLQRELVLRMGHE